MNDSERLARLEERNKALEERIKSLEESSVTRREFFPVRNFVYGAICFLMSSMAFALWEILKTCFRTSVLSQ
jgi:hypothetical protein